MNIRINGFKTRGDNVPDFLSKLLIGHISNCFLSHILLRASEITTSLQAMPGAETRFKATQKTSVRPARPLQKIPAGIGLPIRTNTNVGTVKTDKNCQFDWLLLIFRAIAILAIIAGPFPVFGAGLPFQITRGETVMGGKRYFSGSGNGQPVILLHGLFQEAGSWDHFAENLRAQGHDVWSVNLPGHGEGHERSSLRGDRSDIESLVSEFLPALVTEVNARTKMKVALVGHSLGGSVAELYLSGAYQQGDGNLDFDPELSEQRSRLVSHAVAIAAPTDMNHLKNHILTYGFKGAYSARRIADGMLSLGTFLDPTGISRRVGQTMIKNGQGLMLQNTMPRGLINPENFQSGTGEFQEVLAGFSQLPSDLMESFNKFTSGGGYLLAGGAPIAVPLLLVAGEYDEITPPQTIMNQVSLMGDRARAAVLPGFSHLDLINGSKSARLVGRFVGEFLREGGPVCPRGMEF
jgi:pimeloyl-ACP methyl ester carboxylesterase